MDITRAHDRLAGPGPAEWFTGEVWAAPIAATPTGAHLLRVTFSPGARTAWHTHPRGQTLEIVSGRARIGRDDGRVEELTPGDVAWFEPGERHWHGASEDGPMVHLAMQEADEQGEIADWGEHVTDEQYRA